MPIIIFQNCCPKIDGQQFFSTKKQGQLYINFGLNYTIDEAVINSFTLMKGESLI